MHYSKFILSLDAAASAVDVRFYDNQQCGGNFWLQCTGIAFDTCCFGSLAHIGGAASVAWIPSDWRLLTRSYLGPECCKRENLLHEFPSNGATFIYHGANKEGKRYTGADYSFSQKTRGEAGTCDPGETCAKDQNSDTSFLQDRKKYAVSDIDEDSFERLVSFFIATFTMVTLSVK
jgi:hypothetical protein